MDGLWSAAEEEYIAKNLRVSIVGSRETVKRQLEEVIAATRPDELILTAQIYDRHARLHSLEIAAEVMAET